MILQDAENKEVQFDNGITVIPPTAEEYERDNIIQVILDEFPRFSRQAVEQAVDTCQQQIQTLLLELKALRTTNETLKARIL